jgi:hypothetical protein
MFPHTMRYKGHNLEIHKSAYLQQSPLHMYLYLKNSSHMLINVENMKQNKKIVDICNMKSRFYVVFTMHLDINFQFF